MKKVILGLLTISSLSVLAEGTCGKVDTIGIRPETSTTVKLVNDDKVYYAYDSAIASSLVSAKTGNLTVCIKMMFKNGDGRISKVLIRD